MNRHRILVWQAAEPALPIGVLRVGELATGLWVIAKATFSFAQDDLATLAPQQMPLSFGEPLPSDFAPAPPWAALDVRGHAYAERPADTLDVRVAVAGLVRSARISAARPATRLPLGEASWDEGAGDARPVRFPAGAVIEMEGLSPCAARRVVRLPERALEVTLTRRRGEERVEMTGDTLSIDADREVATLVFRGYVPLEGARARVDRLRVQVGPAGPVRRRHFSFALEPEDAAGQRPPDPVEEARLTAALLSVGGEVAPSMPLAQYAAVSAELAEGRAPRAEVLRRHGLDEAEWTLEERAWLGRIGEGVRAGDARTAMRYGELYAAAQDALALPGEATRTARDYAIIGAAMEREEAATVLEEHGMSLPVWLRLARRIEGEALRDPARAAELAKARREARAAAGGRE